MCWAFGIKAENRPQLIPSKLTELKSTLWYEKAGEGWMNFLSMNPEDKNGWLEYYKATTFSNAAASELDQIRKEINTLFPGSREAYYVNFRAQGWNEEGVSYLKQAIAQDFENHSFLAEELVLAEVAGDRSLRRSLSKLLFEAKIIYPGLLNYAYNVLMSTGQEGILITEGEHSTIPLWILQDVMGVRSDVKVLNLDLVENQNFIEDWMDQHMIQAPENTEKSALIQELPLKNPEKAFYYALTLSNKDLISLEESLYVVGLVSQHTQGDFDNYEVLKKNVEQRFLLDYLTVDFNGEPKTATGRVYETNYIVPFLLLKEYYDEVGDLASADYWRAQIMQVAERSDLSERVLRLLDVPEPTDREMTFKLIEIPVKTFDKKMKLVRDRLYAADAEVTNKDYWFYLDYLYTNGYEDLYQKSIVDKSKYDPLTASYLDNYHYSPVNVQVQKARAPKEYSKRYNDYPALDMTHEAATAYCEWLTFQYNNQPTRKYKKVKFRLPERKEWTMAALGYKEFQSWELSENKITALAQSGRKKSVASTYELNQYVVDYPWALRDFGLRNSIRNNVECYLANVKAADEVTCPAGIKGDGFTLTSPVGTYFANEMGLFDVIGNVAEMTNLNGIAMGGSWNHAPDESTITSINRYDGSDIAVGFRLFMEVIEE